MSASENRARTSDKVFVNVGGEVFQTTMCTLITNSEFFSRKFSTEWSSDTEDEIFLDRDADSFRVLLSCMRHRMALLPENDPLLCTRVLLEAQFLGVDWLLEHVKGVALKHMQDPDDEASECPANEFDQQHGSLEEALRSGVLPARFFGPAKTGLKRVKQIIPAGEHDSVTFDEEVGDTCRTVCYALLDNERGESVIEPVVAYDNDIGSHMFCLASEMPRRDCWEMSSGHVVREECHYKFTASGASVDDLERFVHTYAKDGYCVKAVLQHPGRRVIMEKRVQPS